MTDYTMPLAGLITTILIIILGIVDLIFVLRRGTGSSVSTFLINVGFKSPVFVFAIGFVCGHLFGYMSPKEPVEPPPIIKLFEIEKLPAGEAEIFYLVPSVDENKL